MKDSSREFWEASNKSAFPRTKWNDYTKSYEQNVLSGGLTKREYFAAMVIQGLCANPNITVTKIESDVAQFYATSALNIADELIKKLR